MQQLSVSKVSLNKSSVLPPELHIPLWSYDAANCTAGTGFSTAMNYFVSKNSSTYTTTVSGNNYVRLYTINPNSSTNTRYALEISAYSGNVAWTSSAALFDTAGTGTLITPSIVNGGTTNVTTARSSKFQLSPGITIGITFWTNSAGQACRLVRASLVVFPQG